jgi:hypothetical protein
MKAKLMEKLLKEGLDEELLRVCRLLGEAHDKVMEAVEIVTDLDYFDEDTDLDSLLEAIEDLDYTISEFDFMGEDNPVEELKNRFL